jgi:hypothetical protein
MRHSFFLSFKVLFLAFIVMGPGLKSATAQSTLSGKPFRLSGFTEVYYAYDFNVPSGKSLPFVVNHKQHNSFSVNLAVINAAYEGENVRGGLGLHTGTYVQYNYSLEPPALRNLHEAWGGFRLYKKLWLDAGVFPSHIGWETAVSSGNWTLTRSLAAEATPYYESGARLTYEAGKFTFCVLLLNGWQNINELNSNKAVGTQIQYRPNDRVLINYSTFNGEGRNQPDFAGKRMRFLDNLYATVQLTPELGIGGGFDFGVEEDTDTSSNLLTYWNPTLVLRYRLSPKWSASLRGEHFNDRHGIIFRTGTANNFQVTGCSLNMDYAPAPNALFRVEGKYLNSKDPVYLLEKRVAHSSTVLTGALLLSF